MEGSRRKTFTKGGVGVQDLLNLVIEYTLETPLFYLISIVTAIVFLKKLKTNLLTIHIIAYAFVVFGYYILIWDSDATMLVPLVLIMCGNFLYAVFLLGQDFKNREKNKDENG